MPVLTIYARDLLNQKHWKIQADGWADHLSRLQEKFTKPDESQINYGFVSQIWTVDGATPMVVVTPLLNFAESWGYQIFDIKQGFSQRGDFNSLLWTLRTTSPAVIR